jgi:hypothetical protein
VIRAELVWFIFHLLADDRSLSSLGYMAGDQTYNPQRRSDVELLVDLAVDPTLICCLLQEQQELPEFAISESIFCAELARGILG